MGEEIAAAGLITFVHRQWISQMKATYCLIFENLLYREQLRKFEGTGKFRSYLFFSASKGQVPRFKFLYQKDVFSIY